MAEFTVVESNNPIYQSTNADATENHKSGVVEAYSGDTPAPLRCNYLSCPLCFCLILAWLVSGAVFYTTGDPYRVGSNQKMCYQFVDRYALRYFCMFSMISLPCSPAMLVCTFCNDSKGGPNVTKCGWCVFTLSLTTYLVIGGLVLYGNSADTKCFDPDLYIWALVTYWCTFIISTFLIFVLFLFLFIIERPAVGSSPSSQLVVSSISTQRFAAVSGSQPPYASAQVSIIPDAVLADVVNESHI